MGVLAGIVVALIVLVAGVVMMFRGERTRRAQTAAEWERLAGTLRGERTPGRLTGTCRGRPYAIRDVSLYSGKGSNRHVEISIATSASTTFELHQQQSTLVARLVNDVEIGGTEFDRWFIVRTDDPSRAAQALPEDMRRQLVDGLRAGWLDRVWIKDGRLYFQGGHGIKRPADVTRVSDVFHALERLATALE